MSEPPPPLLSAQLTWQDVFGPASRGQEVFLALDDWRMPVLYFVGRNGSGKSRAATAIARGLNGRHLATDRLVGLMKFITAGRVCPIPARNAGFRSPTKSGD